MKFDELIDFNTDSNGISITSRLNNRLKSCELFYTCQYTSFAGILTAVNDNINEYMSFHVYTSNLLLLFSLTDIVVKVFFIT